MFANESVYFNFRLYNGNGNKHFAGQSSLKWYECKNVKVLIQMKKQADHSEVEKISHNVFIWGHEKRSWFELKNNVCRKDFYLYSL